MSRMLLVLALATVALSACGPFGEELHTLNAKVVSIQVLDGADESTFQQDAYTVGPASRLLLRSENLMDKTSSKVAKSARIRLYFPEVKDGSQWKNALKVCPLTRQWMMLATWTHAHPFGPPGRWARDGGDYSEAGCMKPATFVPRVEKPSTNPDVAQEVTPASVEFDALQYMNDFVVGRSNDQNFGLIVVSTETIRVQGDKGSFRPTFDVDYGTWTWNP